MNHCLRHYEEPIADHCRDCHQPYCGRCLVYSFGPKKPPLCVGCALHAGGIRNGNRPTPVAPFSETPEVAPTSKREERAHRRAERDALKAGLKAAKKAARKGAAPTPAADLAAARGGSPMTVPGPLLASGGPTAN